MKSDGGRWESWRRKWCDGRTPTGSGGAGLPAWWAEPNRRRATLGLVLRRAFVKGGRGARGERRGQRSRSVLSQC